MKKVNVKTPFGFDRAGNVYDYLSAKKGVEYYCACGEPLRIRGGEIIKNHFWHVNPSNCTNESILHKTYKEVFKRIKKIKLPACLYEESELIDFEAVELEKSIQDFRPDAIGYKNGKQYLIEFAYCSKIDKRKKRKIENSNLFCIEVNLKIGLDLYTIKEIEKHISEYDWGKEIINLPRQSSIIDTEVYKSIIEENNRLKRLVEELNRETAELTTQIPQSDFEYFLKFKGVCKTGAGFYLDKKNGIKAFATREYLKICPNV